MEKEHVDPVYKYVDDKIKLIKRELQQLKVAHDAVANQHAQMLLVTQQMVAALKIDTLTNTSCAIIDDIRSSQKANLRTQIVADAASAKSKLLHSKNPYDIANQFKDKWLKILQDSGGSVVTF